MKNNVNIKAIKVNAWTLITEPNPPPGVGGDAVIAEPDKTSVVYNGYHIL